MIESAGCLQEKHAEEKGACYAVVLGRQDDDLLSRQY